MKSSLAWKETASVGNWRGEKTLAEVEGGTSLCETVKMERKGEIKRCPKEFIWWDVHFEYKTEIVWRGTYSVVHI